MTECIMQKRPPRHSGEVGAFPADDEARKVLHKAPNHFRADIKGGRNLRQLRLLFAIIQFFRDHVEGFQHRTKEQMVNILKIETGHTTPYRKITTGEIYEIPNSISFANMDQTEFAEWFDLVCQVLLQGMPGNTPEEIRQELLAMVDGRAAA
jgi:hypothetical protein